MANVLAVVLPVFILIGVGLGAGRYRLFSDAAAKALADYTFALAVPALLFRTMATTAMPEASLVALWAAFFGAAFLNWLVAAIATSRLLQRPAADGPSIAMASSFGNVVMLGVPLSLGAFGDAAAASIAVLISLHTPLLFSIGALHQLAVADQRQTSIWEMIRDLAIELGRNPIILAILAGTLWRLTGIGLHPVLDRVLLILAQSSIATSLISLGLSLVGFQIHGQAPTLSMVLVLKLVLMPITAWLLAVQVFALSPVAAGVVVLFAAMPTGANAYIFAVKSGRAANSTSGAVALGTMLAVLTATIAVYAVGLK